MFLYSIWWNSLNAPLQSGLLLWLGEKAGRIGVRYMACPYFIFEAFTCTWSNSCGPGMQEESNIISVNFLIESPVLIEKRSLGNDSLNNRLFRSYGSKVASSFHSQSPFLFPNLCWPKIIERERWPSKALWSLILEGGEGVHRVASLSIIGGQWRLVICIDFMRDEHVACAQKILQAKYWENNLK